MARRKKRSTKLFKKKSTAKKGGYKVKKIVRYKRVGKKKSAKPRKRKRRRKRKKR